MSRRPSTANEPNGLAAANSAGAGLTDFPPALAPFPPPTTSDRIAIEPPIAEPLTFDPMKERRERMATAILAAEVARGGLVGSAEAIANDVKRALQYADALIAELDR